MDEMLSKVDKIIIHLCDEVIQERIAVDYADTIVKLLYVRVLFQHKMDDYILEITNAVCEEIAKQINKSYHDISL